MLDKLKEPNRKNQQKIYYQIAKDNRLKIESWPLQNLSATQKRGKFSTTKQILQKLWR